MNTFDKVTVGLILLSMIAVKIYRFWKAAEFESLLCEDDRAEEL